MRTLFKIIFFWGLTHTNIGNANCYLLTGEIQIIPSASTNSSDSQLFQFDIDGCSKDKRIDLDSKITISRSKNGICQVRSMGVIPYAINKALLWIRINNDEHSVEMPITRSWGYHHGTDIVCHGNSSLDVEFAIHYESVWLNNHHENYKVQFPYFSPSEPIK